MIFEQPKRRISTTRVYSYEHCEAGMKRTLSSRKQFQPNGGYDDVEAITILLRTKKYERFVGRKISCSIYTYVFRDDNPKKASTLLKEDGALPICCLVVHLKGKTTLAKVLLQELDVDSMDILEINELMRIV